MSNCSKYVLGDKTLQGESDYSDGSGKRYRKTNSIKPDYLELFGLLFDFNELECKVYQVLHTLGSKEAGELAEKLNRDRSTVSRALNRLHEEGFVIRRRRVLRSGGQAYEYTARNPRELRHRAHGRLEEWSDSAHESIEEFLQDVSQ
jgi:predicted transcriptional regulator